MLTIYHNRININRAKDGYTKTDVREEAYFESDDTVVEEGKKSPPLEFVKSSAYSLGGTGELEPTTTPISPKTNQPIIPLVGYASSSESDEELALKSKIVKKKISIGLVGKKRKIT